MAATSRFNAYLLQSCLVIISHPITKCKSFLPMIYFPLSRYGLVLEITPTNLREESQCLICLKKEGHTSHIFLTEYLRFGLNTSTLPFSSSYRLIAPFIQKISWWENTRSCSLSIICIFSTISSFINLDFFPVIISKINYSLFYLEFEIKYYNNLGIILSRGDGHF